MRTVDRVAKQARDLREHLAPEQCNECAAIAVLADGLVQLARQGMGAPVAEYVIAEAGRALGIAEDVAP